MKEKHAGKPVRILIVEDEITSRETLSSILRDRGYEVVAVGSGLEAVEKTKKAPFDIALIDIILGEFNGVETFKKLKKINPSVVAIMMTAYTIGNLVGEALENGAHSCIYKPFDIGRIIGLIDGICKRSN